MEFKIWPEKPSLTIELGGEKIEVKPLTLENAMRLVLLLSPYILAVEHRWPELQWALEATNGTRPQLLQTIFMQLHGELAFTPGVITQALAICLNVDPEFIARNAKAEDLVRALPMLDAVNDFRSLWAEVKALGIVVKYA